jgi:hypothetical protein
MPARAIAVNADTCACRAIRQSGTAGIASLLAADQAGIRAGVAAVSCSASTNASTSCVVSRSGCAFSARHTAAGTAQHTLGCLSQRYESRLFVLHE